MEIRVKQGDFQHRFLLSQAKFPSMICGIGTGKTMCMLVKLFDYCELYPGTTALVVRKEFTDLKDSTMRDFEHYFGVTIGADKDYTLPNGSKIMFRHAAEIEVLKNINLGIAAIEQAEEFETDEQFQFIRDRLRQNNGAEIRPILLIANANGHNWIWKTWINNPPSEHYEAIQATTFDNEHNLPPDFIADLRRMEKEAPTHFRRYVMNSHEETEEGDALFSFQELEEARKREYAPREGYGLRLTGFDIARYGNDKCAAVCIQQMGALIWKVAHVEAWEHKDLDYTTGRILSIVNAINSSGNIIDEDGIGAGPLDTLNKGRGLNYKGFRNPVLNYQDNKFFGNNRTKNAFKLKEMVSKGHISLVNQDLCEELSTLKFKFSNDGRRILISKEEMRKEGIKSPNLADALIMAVSLVDDVKLLQDIQYSRPQQYYKEVNLFDSAGVR